jgi:hypothetical protein
MGVDRHLPGESASANSGLSGMAQLKRLGLGTPARAVGGRFSARPSKHRRP